MSKKTFNDQVDELFDDLVLPADNEIRKETGYAKSSGSKTGQKRSDEQKVNMSSWQKGKPKEEATKEKIGDAMRGKTLEELLGEERAAEGRKKRSEAHKGKKRPEEVVQKIAATRRANGSYDHNGMTGKTHKESTKEIQGQKARIRQELKRKLGLGKSDSVPKDLLEKEYKKQGLL
jgi:hypothetical protein